MRKVLYTISALAVAFTTLGTTGELASAGYSASISIDGYSLRRYVEHYGVLPVTPETKIVIAVEEHAEEVLEESVQLEVDNSAILDAIADHTANEDAVSEEAAEEEPIEEVVQEIAEEVVQEIAEEVVEETVSNSGNIWVDGYEAPGVDSVTAGMTGMNAVSTDWDYLIVVDPEASHAWIVDQEGGELKNFPVATGKGGLSNVPMSYGTPVGAMEVGIGITADVQEIIRWKTPTGQYAPVDVPGTTAYVTSALVTLESLEGRNSNSKSRNIYIHGTNKLSSLGKGSESGGCIRIDPEVAIWLAGLVYTYDFGVYVLERNWQG